MRILGGNAPSFREFAGGGPLTVGSIQGAMLGFLRARRDVVLLGAHAVNAYVDPPRMTQDIDLAAIHAAKLAAELRDYLEDCLEIAAHVLEVGGGRGYRVYQGRKGPRRYLVDIRAVEKLPPSQWVEDIQVVDPAELIAQKVTAYHRRRGRPKSGTDWRDLAALLLVYPALKSSTGMVRASLEANGAEPAVLAAWEGIVAQEILPEDEEDEF